MATFAENPYYREYERLLIELHRLVALGEGDSPAADLVRDQMDLADRHLSQDEVARLKGLSGDLYQISGEESYDLVEDARRIADLGEKLGRAQAKAAWARVLEVLRHRPRNSSDAVLAEMRADAYWRLGHPRAALEFAHYVVAHYPESGSAKYLELETLTQLGMTDRALERCDEFSCAGSDSLWWLARAVPLLVRAGEANVQRRRWTRIRDGLLHLLAEPEALKELPPRLTAQAWASLLVCHLEMGEPLSALYAFNKLEYEMRDFAEIELIAALGPLFSGGLEGVDERWSGPCRESVISQFGGDDMALIKPGIMADLTREPPVARR